MRAVSASIVALSLALATGAVADPFKPGVKDQIALGQRAAKEIRKKEKVLPDNDWRSRLVRRIGTRILGAIGTGKNEPWEYSFDVIDSKELNAFALPGGPTFFYTGLIDKLSTEDQIAAVIGHELVHVRKEHWARAYADQQKRGLGLTALLMIFNAGRTVADVTGIANELLLSLPFSRRNETDADNGGIELLDRAGYNPSAMADVFRMFGAQKGNKPPEFLNTHPSDKRRVQNIEKKVASLGKGFPSQVPLPDRKATTAGEPKISWLPRGSWADR